MSRENDMNSNALPAGFLAGKLLAALDRGDRDAFSLHLADIRAYANCADSAEQERFDLLCGIAEELQASSAPFSEKMAGTCRSLLVHLADGAARPSLAATASAAGCR